MAPLLKALDRLAALTTAAALAVASLAIFGQVILRYLFGSPVSWAEELAVLLFAWITFAGAAHVQASDSHLAIDTARRVAGPRLGLALDVTRLAVIVAVCAVLIWHGLALARRTLPLLFPAMGVTRALLYGAVPVCFAVILVLAAAQLVARTRGRDATAEPELDHTA